MLGSGDGSRGAIEGGVPRTCLWSGFEGGAGATRGSALR